MCLKTRSTEGCIGNTQNIVSTVFIVRGCRLPVADGADGSEVAAGAGGGSLYPWRPLDLEYVPGYRGFSVPLCVF